MSIFDKSRHKLGRIITPSTEECVEFGNRSKLWEIGSDGVRGFGTSLTPGYKLSKDTAGISYLSYALWNQSSELLLDPDQDQDGAEDTHVMVVENTSGGGDEDGYGYVTGADLTWSTSGVAGMSGGWRSFDGNNDSMTITNDLANIFSSTDPFCVIIKFKDYTQINESIFHLQDSGGNNYLVFNRSGASPSKCKGIIVIGGTSKINTDSTDDLPNTGTYYAVVGSDGSTYFFGVTSSGSGAAGQPTRWSDFSSGLRFSNSTSQAQFGSNVFDQVKSVGFDGGSAYASFSLAWIVLSRICLISGVS